MSLVGYGLALLMGMTLGLIGAGGSILSVPIFVYFLKVKPVVATGYSLLVVGSAALFATISNWRKGHVQIKTVISFAIPAMLAVLTTRALILPAIPEVIIGISKDHLIMIFFVLLMFLAAFYMLKPNPEIQRTNAPANKAYSRIILGAVAVGLFTGLVGAGGGFLIVPSLIGFFGLGVRQAIATSLAVIALNSLVGLNGDIHSGILFDWPMIIYFLAATFSGIILGMTMGNYISAPYLKRLFAYFILLMAALILLSESYELLQPMFVGNQTW